ncbi:MAG: TA system VapC family ribonuclease toxin [bacterium]
MIAVDTNILVYAHRKDSEFNGPAFELLRNLSGGRQTWAIPWPCLHEFYAITTHARIYSPPSSPAQAMQQIDAWLESPTLTLIGETETYWPILRNSLASGKVAGPMVHDARIAAICELHGVVEFLSADRDFGRFPGLKTRNPLVR